MKIRKGRFIAICLVSFAAGLVPLRSDDSGKSNAVDVLTQHRASCAELASYGLLTWNGIVVKPEQITKSFKASFPNSSLQDIVTTLKHFNFASSAFQVKVAEFRSLKLPVIAHLNVKQGERTTGHFTLIVARDSEGVTCVDPLFDVHKPAVIPWDSFESMFSGYFISSIQ